jgi:hypothetical protein
MIKKLFLLFITIIVAKITVAQTPAVLSGACIPAAFTTPIGIGSPDGIADRVVMPSTMVGIATLPDTKASNGGELTFGQGTMTAGDQKVEVSISKCAGVIINSGDSCYYKSVFNNFNAVFWVSRPTSTVFDKASAEARQLCWAPESAGTWYINVRYSYSNCPFSSCGYSVQWMYSNTP